LKAEAKVEAESRKFEVRGNWMIEDCGWRPEAVTSNLGPLTSNAITSDLHRLPLNLAPTLFSIIC
jgi:hypothetical protein